MADRRGIKWLVLENGWGKMLNLEREVWDQRVQVPGWMLGLRILRWAAITNDHQLIDAMQLVYHWCVSLDQPEGQVVPGRRGSPSVRYFLGLNGDWALSHSKASWLDPAWMKRLGWASISFIIYFHSISFAFFRGLFYSVRNPGAVSNEYSLTPPVANIVSHPQLYWHLLLFSC